MYHKKNSLPLYKYVTKEVAEIVLVNRTLRWSSPTLFDDPLDVKREFDLGFPVTDLIEPIIDVSHIKYNPVFRWVALPRLSRHMEQQTVD